MRPYVAGLNRGGRRFFPDIDIFHHREESVAAAADTDVTCSAMTALSCDGCGASLAQLAS
jgi:hypothetical protein